MVVVIPIFLFVFCQIPPDPWFFPLLLCTLPALCTYHSSDIACAPLPVIPLKQMEVVWLVGWVVVVVVIGCLSIVLWSSLWIFIISGHGWNSARACSARAVYGFLLLRFFGSAHFLSLVPQRAPQHLHHYSSVPFTVILLSTEILLLPSSTTPPPPLPR